MQPVTFTAYTDDQAQIEAIKAFMKALKIKFDLKKEEEPYNTAFVEKVLESREEARKGQVTRVEKDDLKAFLGL